MSTITELKNDIEAKAKTFWSGSATVRETFYTMASAHFLSEADARSMFATGPYFITATEGNRLKIMPKAPQRKNDGDRGAQMNFWLYDDNRDYYQKFNLHVDVLSLEKHYIAEIKKAQDPGWELQPKELERQANAAAKAERTSKGWSDFAKKPG